MTGRVVEAVDSLMTKLGMGQEGRKADVEGEGCLQRTDGLHCMQYACLRYTIAIPHGQQFLEAQTIQHNSITCSHLAQCFLHAT